MTFHITCNTDDKYVQHCFAMLCSLFENTPGEIIVHILTVNLSEDNRKGIVQLAERYGNSCIFHDVNPKILENVKFRENVPLSPSAYCRILLPSLINDDVDRILYLDCDIIVVKDLKELYEIELEQYALAACLDTMPYTSLHRKQLHMSIRDIAFCSGVMMINLKYWRETNAQNKLLEYSCRDREHVYLHDQDSLNYVFKNQWFVLPPKWNKPPMSYLPDKTFLRRFDVEEYVYSPSIIHYSAWPKPWFDVWFPNRKYYRKYLALSGYEKPTFIHVKTMQRTSYWLNNVRYCLSNFVMPYLPHVVLMIIDDIFRIFIGALSIFNKNWRRKVHIDNSLNKY